MIFGLRSTRVIFGATAAATVCLLAVVSAGGQAGPQPNARPDARMVEDVYKSVVLLRGIPVDQFFEAMGMFAASMNDDCTFCHVREAALRDDAFATPTPRIQKARQMITMVQAINKSYFAGEQRVTCFSCHRGAHAPRIEPSLAVQYGTVPEWEDPGVMELFPDPRANADEILNKYVQALGGAERLAKITSFVASGTYTGFDVGGTEVPVRIFARAPDQRATIVSMVNGESRRVFDGRRAWQTGPNTPASMLTLTGGNLKRARLEAILAFPAGIRNVFSQWKATSTLIDDERVQVVQGLTPGEPPINLYFDDSGLLVRMVGWTETPVGPVPTQYDYGDYREVAGVQMPFRWTVSQTYMQSTIALSELQPNVRIEDARFAEGASVAQAGR